MSKSRASDAMLKTVVEQVQLRSEFLLGKNTGRVAVFADDDWNAQTPRHQQRFVAEIMRRTCGIDQGDSRVLRP